MVLQSWPTPNDSAKYTTTLLEAQTRADHTQVDVSVKHTRSAAKTFTCSRWDVDRTLGNSPSLL